jgi:hypothetical protein
VSHASLVLFSQAKRASLLLLSTLKLATPNDVDTGKAPKDSAILETFSRKNLIRKIQFSRTQSELICEKRFGKNFVALFLN